eukprot:scaffold25793_cov66-Phaeocystis_antarctica.AAC.1
MVAGLQHALQRLERLELPRLQASATTVAGLQHAVHSLELLVRVNVGLTACSTRSGASSSRGYRYRRAPLRLQDFGCRPAARVAAPRAPGQCQGED